MNQAIKRARELIEKSQLNQAIEVLMREAKLRQLSDLEDICVSLKARLENYQRKESEGILRAEERNVEINEITTSCLGLLRRMKRRLEGEQNIELSQLVSSLNIEEIGPIHLINCNRQEKVEHFWNRHDTTKSDQPVHLYFILSCNTQQPDSLAARTVYEIIDYELDEDDKAIQYERMGSEAEDPERLKLHPLKVANTVDRTLKLFKRAWARRFGLVDGDFERLRSAESPIKGYDYVISAYKLSERDWKDHLVDCFKEIAELFQGKEENLSPHFIFFFVLHMDRLHIEEASRHVRIRQQLESLRDEDNRMSIIEKLMPVKIGDINDWFIDLGIENQTQIDEIREILIQELPYNKLDAFHESGKLDMSDMEEKIQRRIYNIINESL